MFQQSVVAQLGFKTAIIEKYSTSWNLLKCRLHSFKGNASSYHFIELKHFQITELKFGDVKVNLRK
jgi:hypothetical protein